MTLFRFSGLESAAQFHLAEVHAEGLLEERDIVAATETARTQRPGTVQQRQHQGLTTISLEEQKILLSLDRLNHQLYSEHLLHWARTDQLHCCHVYIRKLLICCLI